MNKFLKKQMKLKQKQKDAWLTETCRIVNDILKIWK